MPIVLVAVMLAGHLSWKTVKGNQAFRWMLQIAIAIAAKGGHTFRGANLTDADFTGATLKLCDLRGANLKRTRLFEAKGLEFSRLGNTYLANPKIRQLVVTLNGQAQNFDGLNLEGVNLQDANLQDASFIGANLNHANLQNTDLSRAILKQAQLDGADLTGAILTGACIEDWGITGTTKLEGVRCDYIFMRLETKDNPDRLRKPDNWRETFADGEFSDFIKPYVDTLDLYHSQDIDPRAISIALKNLSVNHPEEKLQFVAIERRGGNGLNLRFTTAPGADKSELSHEYFTDYARIKKELPIAVQLRLAEQDAEIRTLKGTIEQFIEAGTHQSKIQAETIQVIQGELVVTENKGINITSGGGSIGDISGLVGGDVSGVVNLGTISGNVTNTINQLPDASEPDQPNLKELLTQLQQAIENDSNLSDPDKADLLEQVQVLAEAKQTEEPAKKEGLARKARKMFDATLSSLPQTASIVEACSKLLPMVLKALGVSA
ncbi:pentapeptide repeat-containing protein [Allocoleopsis franciscana]|nr:pentapeptide repeat-containing protein [Allocoleopsis franciscana]